MEPSWPLSLEIPVAWGDMDALGHVNNVVYLRWFESARIACFAEAEIIDMAERGPILARQEINYLTPVVFPDSIEVGIRVARLGTTSFDLAFEMRRQSDGAAVASGLGVHVWYDFRSQQKMDLDAQVREKLSWMR